MESSINKEFNNLNLNNSKELMDSTAVPFINQNLKQISNQTPLEDYDHNMVAETDYEYIDDDEFVKYGYWYTFAQARNTVWKLLFNEKTLTAENCNKASQLLEDYRCDALMIAPRDYNLWIPTVKDELLKRKYFDFWQNVIVEKQLGLCCGTDAKFADDMLDGKDPEEFYKVMEEFIEQQ
ncbi:uncharacterized protein LOC119607690 [Lucilia sericata]|uniref:uncharacterized protein LOC119607690 n=1 Tax=Lucilia sericata TaxID=13632 RepID=UPI0018A87083|nr:uncharacterized protein LOC119607690 [Lucilia sericata]